MEKHIADVVGGEHLSVVEVPGDDSITTPNSDSTASDNQAKSSVVSKTNSILIFLRLISLQGSIAFSQYLNFIFFIF